MTDSTSPAAGFHSYVRMVRGLGLMAKDRAATGAHALLAQAGLDEAATDAGERLAKLADEVALAGRANREMLEALIVTEVERASDRLGFVRPTEVAALRTELSDLRDELAGLRAEVAATSRSGS